MIQKSIQTILLFILTVGVGGDLSATEQNTCSADCCSINVLPGTAPLFRPLLANPRQVNFSLGWRYNDQRFATHIVDVSFADQLPLFRIRNLWFCHDGFQMDVEGGLWALFDHLNYSAPLINADYYVGALWTYWYRDWSFRSRFYHISSHIGDEYLLNHPNFDRRNPSAEYLEVVGAYQLTPSLRIYGGYTFVLHCDESFPFCSNRFELGFESHFNFGHLSVPCQNILGVPYFAVHLRLFEDYDYNEDITYVLGYEFTKLNGSCRKIRIFLEYHNGYSLEGQFCNKRTDYLSLRATYGF